MLPKKSGRWPEMVNHGEQTYKKTIQLCLKKKKIKCLFGFVKRVENESVFLGVCAA